ncbi:MAG: lytic transglycosylase domain-containing protein [Acidobacteria bacterium]|nr:lytic transglycosylase domain-containing protein [Acidobacteriota bacterium]MCA1620733.1 lytic transglycosylase domain-containing protein [Acidobacteriota bacterium]
MKTLPPLRKRLAPACALLLFSCLTASAQQAAGGYRFDNFDVPDGVRVEQPPTPPAPATRPRRALKLTARTSSPTAAADASKSPAPASAPRRSAAPAAVAPAPSLQMALGSALDGFSTGDASVDRFIVESSNRHGVDPLLIYSIMHRESSFKKFALSYKGARGLMQLMPATAARLGVRDIFDPRQNIEGGVKYMRILLNMFDGDVRLALAGYNAGEGAVLKYGRNVPPYRETQEYVKRISARYALMRDPSTARIAPRVSRTQIAKLKSAEPPPLVYETNVYAVRTPDGKLRLVSQ